MFRQGEREGKGYREGREMKRKRVIIVREGREEGR
jgi:hypothetical protein